METSRGSLARQGGRRLGPTFGDAWHGDGAQHEQGRGSFEQTLQAGKWLFDRGCDVQSATYPAVPLNAGLLRILENANHSDEAMTGLLAALGDLRTQGMREMLTVRPPWGGRPVLASWEVNARIDSGGKCGFGEAESSGA